MAGWPGVDPFGEEAVKEIETVTNTGDSAFQLGEDTLRQVEGIFCRVNRKPSSYREVRRADLKKFFHGAQFYLHFSHGQRYGMIIHGRYEYQPDFCVLWSAEYILPGLMRIGCVTFDEVATAKIRDWALAAPEEKK